MANNKNTCDYVDNSYWPNYPDPTEGGRYFAGKPPKFGNGSACGWCNAVEKHREITARNDAQPWTTKYRDYYWCRLHKLRVEGYNTCGDFHEEDWQGPKYWTPADEWDQPY